MREDDIGNAITALSADQFERFASELARRELYPGLNPTSPSYDLGEDARTETSTLIMHGGKWISVSVSKTTSLAKIRADCQTRKEKNRPVDIVVYITDEDVRTDVETKWREEIKKDFGWEMELRTMRWLAPAASQPQYESLVDDYLSIPPPDGDYVQAIEVALARLTTLGIEQINRTIPGIKQALPRREIDTIQEQLSAHKSVLLTGTAGSGKSGIAAVLAKKTMDAGKVVLLLDARTVEHVETEAQLRGFLGLNGPVTSAIRRVGRNRGCLLVLDQLDNTAGTPIARLLLELARQMSGSQGVDFLAISRNEEPHESRLVRQLLANGFVELLSSPLSADVVENILAQLGIVNYSQEVIELGRNLLNLELIARIREQQPEFDFTLLTSEVYLWEQFLDVLGIDEGMTGGEQVIAESVHLARQALSVPEGAFELPYPLPRPMQRLISWGIIAPLEGRIYRFRHERFQDFIYAWDATQRVAMPRSVLAEILPHRSRNVFRWMDAILLRANSPSRGRFLKEMLDAG